MKLNYNSDTNNKQLTPNFFRSISNRLFKCIIIFIIFLLFVFVFSALANIVWRGLGGFVNTVANQEIQFAIKLSIFTSITSTLICVAFALPVAYGLERFKIPGHKVINVIFDIPLSLPPLVSGVALLLLLSTTKFGSELAEHGLRFIFSVKGIILAQFFIITPYMIKVLKSTIADINPRLEFVARTLGCSEWQAFYKITLPLAKNGIIAGLVISWARAIGEFGCSLMVAGATRMVTETLPVALYLNMSIGNLETAMTAATCLIIISMISLFIFEIVGVRKSPVSRIN